MLFISSIMYKVITENKVHLPIIKQTQNVDPRWSSQKFISGMPIESEDFGPPITLKLHL